MPTRIISNLGTFGAVSHGGRSSSGKPVKLHVTGRKMGPWIIPGESSFKVPPCAMLPEKALEKGVRLMVFPKSFTWTTVMSVLSKSLK